MFTKFCFDEIFCKLSFIVFFSLYMPVYVLNKVVPFFKVVYICCFTIKFMLLLSCVVAHFHYCFGKT